MITKLKIFESYNLPEYLYHGSDTEHDFLKSGDRYKKNGTFLASSKYHASTYGNVVYKVKLKPNLNLFDSTKISECNKLFKYLNIENTVSINEYPYSKTYTAAELSNYKDNWKVLEKKIIWDWLLENYDGVILTELDSKNVFIKNPVIDKIIAYQIIERKPMKNYFN